MPLLPGDLAAIPGAERAGVGLPDKTVVNLDVRTTWQIKPQGLNLQGIAPILEYVTKQVETDLGLEYTVKANLYKLLLYEPGCFFKKHRDNERLDGMFGTLVLELPSIYNGSELTVWSPLSPQANKTYGFGNDTTTSSVSQPFILTATIKFRN